MRQKKTGTTLTPDYVHVDHLGSALAASNASGAAVWREHYVSGCRPSPTGAFGKGTRTLGSRPANDNNAGFTGHLKDDAPRARRRAI